MFKSISRWFHDREQSRLRVEHDRIAAERQRTFEADLRTKNIMELIKSDYPFSSPGIVIIKGRSVTIEYVDASQFSKGFTFDDPWNRYIEDLKDGLVEEVEDEIEEKYSYEI